MRIFFFFLLVSISHISFAQFSEGFSGIEAKEMMALSSSFTFDDLFGSDKDIIPRKYKKVFTSEVKGMDNKCKIFQDEKTAVICFRGSTDKGISWVENFYSAMVPGKGIIEIKKKEYPYTFADDENAAVHAGYALAIMFLSDEFIPQIQTLEKKGVHHFIITGHSQGGALSTLCRTYLENHADLSNKNQYKTYAFGNPMSGNREFAAEYDKKYSDNGTAFSIVNLQDPIPYMPMNYEEDEKAISKKKLVNWITGKEDFNFRKVGMDLILKTFDGGLTTHVTKTNRLLESLVSLRFGKVEMPAYVRDINFYPAGKRMELDVFEYPKIKAKEKNLTEKEKEKYYQGEDGNWYKKEPKFFQHNPYNYYVGVVKKYRPQDYKKLKKKYLEANL